MFRRGLMLFVICWLTACSTASAEEVYLRIRLNDLKFNEGELPNYRPVALAWKQVLRIPPEVQIDGSGEAYLQHGSSWGIVHWAHSNVLDSVWVAMRAEARRVVSGRLVLPKPDGSGWIVLKFRVPAESASKEAAREFQFAKIEHYERILQLGGPGAAWFRAQSETARKALDQLSTEDQVNLERIARGRWLGQRRGDELDRTYELFSGGRAIIENLQLDRELLLARSNSDDAKPVALESIKGITVK
jgi:hypothetical protein